MIAAGAELGEPGKFDYALAGALRARGARAELDTAAAATGPDPGRGAPYVLVKAYR